MISGSNIRLFACGKNTCPLGSNYPLRRVILQGETIKKKINSDVKIQLPFISLGF